MMVGMTSPEPCRACGAAVRLRTTAAGASLAKHDGETAQRVCTRPECDTNTGQGSLDTVV